MSTWACEACGGENPEGMGFCGHCGARADGLVAESAKERDVAEALRSFVVGSVADRLVEAGGKLPEERRLITALFADVSGFTALADRLDPEELLEVIDPVISGLSSIVGRYEGYVEKFAGDALLALFGAPISHNDDAERALHVALEMHQELARLVQTLPHEADLTLHVGVNSGHGIARVLGSEARMDYAVLGDSVILAQRFESAAPPGETYVSETTVRLTEGEFEFEPIGKLTLKGKAEPVPAWRLLGAHEHRGAVVRSSLVGRERELAIVDEALAELRAGRGSVLAITGEPGIGKSRLIEAACTTATDGGVLWLQTRCLSYGAGLAYWPYIDLIRRWASLRSDEPPPETRLQLKSALAEVGVAEAAPFVARLLGLPVDDDDVARLEPEAFRRGLHAAFRNWLTAIAADASVVLVLEDIHWADASSLELTAELIKLLSSTPIIFLLSGRPEAHEQIENASGDAASRAIQLAPLTATAIAELASAVLGGVAPGRLVEFVVGRTSGNPFFVQELIRAVRERGALVLDEHGWTIRAGWDERELPPTIEGVLAARIDLLSRGAASLLQTASVVGRRVPLPLLEEVVADGSIGDLLAELVRAGFLERGREDQGETVVFHHALVQDAAYSRLLRRRRRELHLRVAEAAEALYGSGDHVIDLLARHLYLGGGGAKAVDYLRRAGERSKRLFANEEAILHFSRAAKLAPEDPELRLALADLHELVGNYDEALQLYEGVCKETSDIRAWRGAASVLRKRGAYAEALDTVEKAFRADELRGQDLTLLWLEQGWTLLSAGRFEQAIDVQQAGLEAAEGRRDAPVGELLLGLVRAESIEGRLTDALEHVLNAKDIFEEARDTRRLATALRVLGDVYTRLDRLDEAATTLRAGVELAERTGSVEEIGGCLINLGLAELGLGNVVEAIACDRRAIEEFERIAHGAGRATAYANLAEKLLQVGNTTEALYYCDRALDLAGAIGNAFTVGDATHTRAAIQLEQGDAVAAGGTAEEAGQLFIEMGAMPAAARSLELAAEAWKKAGEATRARDVSARARALA